MPMQPGPLIQDPLVDAVTFTPAILCLREYDADHHGCLHRYNGYRDRGLRIGRQLRGQ